MKSVMNALRCLAAIGLFMVLAGPGNSASAQEKSESKGKPAFAGEAAEGEKGGRSEEAKAHATSSRGGK